MRTYIAGFNRTSSIPVVLTLLFMAFLGASGMTLRALPGAQKGEFPEVRNQTESFQLVDITTSKEGCFILHMKNTSIKAITAYMVGEDDNSSMMTLTRGNDVLAPGEVDEVHIAFREMPADDTGTLRRQVVIILAVMFDDHSSEGDFEADRQIRDWQLGEMIQLERVNRLLREAVGSPDANQPAAVERLIAQISSLREKQEVGQSLQVHFGLRSVKKIMIFNLSEELSQWQEQKKEAQLKPENLGRVMEIQPRLEDVLIHSERWAAKL